MNKRDTIAKYGADRIWNNHYNYVSKAMQENICSKCRLRECESPCNVVQNNIVLCMWQILSYQARLN